MLCFKRDRARAAPIFYPADRAFTSDSSCPAAEYYILSITRPAACVYRRCSPSPRRRSRRGVRGFSSLPKIRSRHGAFLKTGIRHIRRNGIKCGYPNGRLHDQAPETKGEHKNEESAFCSAGAGHGPGAGCLRGESAGVGSPCRKRSRGNAVCRKDAGRTGGRKRAGSRRARGNRLRPDTGRAAR